MTVRLKQIFILSIFLFSCGSLSFLFGKELCWDLANYHYYLPYAFLHHREYIDSWPSSYVHQYLNPALDFLSLALINHASPKAAEWMLGALSGISVWLLYLISSLLIKDRYASMWAILVSVIGFVGPTALSGIGSFQNDNVICIFTLSSIYFSLQYIQTNNKHYLGIAGLLLGIGVGLKLTAAIYVMGCLGAFLFSALPWRKKISCLSLFSFAAVLGAAISAGYWWYHQWQLHGNPFLPALNNLFHSNDFPWKNWRDTRFLPTSITEAIFFPFYFSVDGRTADAPFRDFRFIAVYVLLIIGFIRTVYLKRMKTSVATLSSATRWLLLFFIFSYIAWEYYFSMARYLVTLEVLAPLVIYVIIKALRLSVLVECIVLLLAYISIILALSPIPMIRKPVYGATYFNVVLPHSISDIKHAIVLIPYSAYALSIDPRPQAYLIPFFPASWQFVGVPFLNNHWLNESKDNELTLRVLRANPAERKYVLTPEKFMPAMQAVATFYHLHWKNRCESIASDRQMMTHEKVFLCEV